MRTVLVALAVLLVLIAALAGHLLTRPAIDMAFLSGSWTGQHAWYEGLIDLELMADGTYEERLHGFEGLPERVQQGTWSIGDGVVVLDGFLMPGANWGDRSASADAPVVYGAHEHWKLPIERGLLARGAVLEVDELVRFTQVKEEAGLPE